MRPHILRGDDMVHLAIDGKLLPRGAVTGRHSGHRGRS